MCRIDRFVKVAAVSAADAGHSLYHLGAVVVKGGKIIGRGCNTALRHAEVNAIRNSKGSTKGAIMIVARISPTGLAMAKPCENCREAIRKAGIKRVYYTSREGVCKLRKRF